MSIQSTAILIFARSARLDAAYKGLYGSERFLDELTRQTLLKARRTGLPCFHFDENSQTGNTFGERLGNAMKTLYEKGAEHLIVIGNDSPDLCTKTLLDAAHKLSEGNTVLGPSPDGGTYLIGISRLQFRLKAFVKLPWQQSDLLEKLIQWNISSGGRPVILDSKLDLDTLTDCRNWVGLPGILYNRLQRLLIGFAALASIIRSVADTRVFSIGYATPFNKGSPF